MDLKLLEAFQALIQYGSIAKASTVLSMDPSTFGKNLIKLESYYGIKLFKEHKRGPKRLELTEAGILLKQEVQKILWLHNRLNQNMRDTKNGYSLMLPITVSPALSEELIEKCLLPYRKENGSFRYELMELSMKEQEQRILQGNAELGYANSPISNPQLFSILKEFPTQYYVIFNRKSTYFNTTGPLALQDLANVPLSLAVSSAPKLLNLLEQKNINYNILCTNIHRSSALLPVRHGEAVTIFPLHKPYEDNELLSLPIDHPLLKSRNVLYVQKGKSLSPTAQSLIDYMLIKL